MAGPSETQESLEIDITLDRGVLKVITKPGDGARPKSGDEVTVHYTGTLDDGTEFDSSRKRGSPFKFTIGKGEVIQGWDKGVETMQHGECCILTIDPQYGYGSRKMGQIPENSRLKFDIELIDFGPAKKDKWTMTTEEKVQAATEAKEKGNDLFKKGEKVAAIAAYLEGIDYFEGFDDWADNAKMQARLLKLALHLNAANTFFQTSAWHEAALQATAALLLDPSNVKALYRRGATRIELKEYDFAREDILNAAKLDPRNVEIRKLLKTCTDLMTEERRHEATKFGGMFSKFAMYSEKFAVRELSKMPKVFMSIKVGEAEPKRLVLSLYADTVPKTVENFRALCAGTNGMGSKGKPLHYKGSIFHRVIPGFIMQGGDFTNRDGTGGESIYGERFPDEKFTDTHSKRGQLSMANAGPNTNGSQFFVTFAAAPHLDGKHVVFGEVFEGFEILDAVESAPTDKENPKEDIVILDCGDA